MIESYSLRQISLLTGLTTRTLRNYMKQGILNGKKADGRWVFSDEDLTNFFENKCIKKALAAKGTAIVNDFLSDTFKKDNRICMILDCPKAADNSSDISDLLCAAINKRATDIVFRSLKGKNNVRIIISGSEKEVIDIMKQYYESGGKYGAT